MKILHLTTYQEGGGGIASLRLHQAMLKANMDSKLLSVFGKENHNEAIFSLQAGPDQISFRRNQQKEKWIRYFQAWKVRLCGKSIELFSFPSSVWEIEDHPLIKEADLIHLHWVAGMVDVKRFFAKINKPIVWTLHDAWPFTGGFHYEKYFNAKPFLPVSKPLLKLKYVAYKQKNITIVSPSRYMLNLCLESNVFQQQQHVVIPNSVPASIYQPHFHRDELRKRLGVKTTDFVLLFVSTELDYFRKGFDILLDAFTTYKNKNIKLFVAGKKGRQVFPSDPRITFWGHVAENHLAELLSASDALVHTSREDNFPNVIIESLTCGTPVLAIDEGGMSEMIDDTNGIRCDENTIKKGFDEIIGMHINRTQIASTAKRNFSPAVQAKRFKQLYISLLMP
jgi:glycosyltransferase involved in cell wall biosynthesis